MGQFYFRFSVGFATGGADERTDGYGEKNVFLRSAPSAPSDLSDLSDLSVEPKECGKKLLQVFSRKTVFPQKILLQYRDGFQ